MKKEGGKWICKVVREHKKKRRSGKKLQYREWTTVKAILSESNWTNNNKLCDWIRERGFAQEQLVKFILDKIYGDLEEVFPGVRLNKANPPAKKFDTEYVLYMWEMYKKRSGRY